MWSDQVSTPGITTIMQPYTDPFLRYKDSQNKVSDRSNTCIDRPDMDVVNWTKLSMQERAA